MLCFGSLRAPEINDVKTPLTSISRGRVWRCRCDHSSRAAPPPPSRPSADYSLTNDDQIFVQLREAARNNDAGRAAQLARRFRIIRRRVMSSTSRSSRSFRLAGHARVDAPDAPVLSFLQRYDGQAIADRMRNDYLSCSARVTTGATSISNTRVSC